MTSSNQPILTIDVPGRAVSANARLGHSKRSRVYLDKLAKDWRETVAGYALAEWAFYRLEHPRPHLPLRIVVRVRGCRGDADNYAKLILDGLADGIKINDRHFNPVELHRVPRGLEPTGVRIEVYEAEEEDRAA